MNPSERPPTLDPLALARWHRIAPLASPWLHEEVAARMIDRLQWIKLQPRSWVHWNAARGGLKAHAALSALYRNSECFLVEASEERRKFARNSIAKPWWERSCWTGAKTRFDQAPPAGVDMLWANMALHEVADPPRQLAQWHAALKVNGFLMFSCLGPDTAIELRQAYRQLGWPSPAHELVDMHDIGDMLVQAGFAEPVMDMERIVLTYDTPARMLRELRGLGRNLHRDRFAALRGPHWRQALEAALDASRTAAPGGRLGLTFEIIYGHAVKPPPRVRVRPESTVSMDAMRGLLKGSSGRPPAVKP